MRLVLAGLQWLLFYAEFSHILLRGLSTYRDLLPALPTFRMT